MNDGGYYDSGLRGGYGRSSRYSGGNPGYGDERWDRNERGQRQGRGYDSDWQARGNTPRYEEDYRGGYSERVSGWGDDDRGSRGKRNPSWDEDEQQLSRGRSARYEEDDDIRGYQDDDESEYAGYEDQDDDEYQNW